MGDDVPIERTSAEARQATRRGRVVRILALSMTLALVAMGGVLAWVYLVHGDPYQ